MTDDRTRRALLRAVGAVGIGAGAMALFPSVAAAAPLTRVLVFSGTTGSRHDSPAGIAAVRQLDGRSGFAVDATEDATRSTTRYQAVVWPSTTGDVLDGWTWHGSLVGAYFAAHPAHQQATLVVEDRTNDSTAHLPATRSTNPRGSVNVHMRVDESSSSGGAIGADHPITWWHDVGAGRAWYTGLGRTDASYSDTRFTRLLLGGIRVAVRAVRDAGTRTNSTC